MNLLSIVSVMAATTVLAVWIICHYRTKRESPQFKCEHQMTVQKTWSGPRSNEYLSTCTKCGYQKTHFFCGTNLS